MRKRSKGLAEGIMVIFWLIYVFLILSIYECNLRANLASVPLERVINDENDIVDLGKKLYFPLSSPFIPMFKHSPFAIQRRYAVLNVLISTN